jgi:hypothetical protein
MPENVNPTETGDVGDAVLVPDQVFVILQLLVKYPSKALGLAGVPLHAVWNALLRKTVEVVGLSLHGTEPTMLPCHPLFSARNIEIVGEAEFVLGVVVTRKVGQDCCHSQH